MVGWTSAMTRSMPPMASTTSRPAARAARPDSTSAVALATSSSAVIGFSRNSAAELRSAVTA